MLHLRLASVSVRWLPAGAAAVLWALAAGSAVLWALHLPRQGEGAAFSSAVASAGPVAPTQTAVARALGHAEVVQAAPEAHKRFQLLGVIAAGSGQGSALIAVDGQPAQAFVQGQSVAEGWRLQSLTSHGLVLQGQGAANLLRLELPD